MFFISYKSEEFEQASAVRDMLEAHGMSCWMAPDSILPGSEYGQAITDAIRNCDALVLILTEAAQASTPVLSEVDLAITFKKTIIPFHLDDVPLNDAFLFRLGIFQRIEAAGRLNDGYQELIKRARSLTMGEVLPDASTEPNEGAAAPDSLIVRRKPTQEERKKNKGTFVMHCVLLAVLCILVVLAVNADPDATAPMTYVALTLAVVEMGGFVAALYRVVPRHWLGEGWQPGHRLKALARTGMFGVLAAALTAVGLRMDGSTPLIAQAVVLVTLGLGAYMGLMELSRLALPLCVRFLKWEPFDPPQRSRVVRAHLAIIGITFVLLIPGAVAVANSSNALLAGMLVGLVVALVFEASSLLIFPIDALLAAL